MTKYLIRLIVENHTGVMSRIAGLLSRKGYNIKSICVGSHIEPDEASIVMTIDGSKDEVEQAKEQLGKLINVISSEYYPEEEILEREFALIRVKTSEGVDKKAESTGSKIITRNGETIVEIVDTPENVVRIIKEFKKEFEVLDISRSGTNAI